MSRDYIGTIDDRGMLSLWKIHIEKKGPAEESSTDLKEHLPLWSIPTGFVARRRRYKLAVGGDTFQILLLVHGPSFASAVGSNPVELSNESYVMQVIETIPTSSY